MNQTHSNKIALPTLYDKDSHGKIRYWTMFISGANFWAESGIEGGKNKVDRPTTAKPKNVGRANATTPEEQAQLDAQSKWDKKIKEGYQQDKSKAGEYYFYKPMLADKFPSRKKNVEEALNNDVKVFCQPKLDGIRCIMRLEDGEIVARSRMGSTFDTLEHIKDELRPLFDADPNMVLDGELYNHKFKENFNKIVSIIKQIHPDNREKGKDEYTEARWAKIEAEWAENVAESVKYAQYHIYDAPKINGLVESDNFSNRIDALANTIPMDGKSIVLVQTLRADTMDELNNEYESYLSQGYEGQMVRIDGAYASDRRPIELLKRKEFIDIEAEILEITEGKGNWAGYAKSIRAKMDNGKEFDSNTIGDFEYTKDLLDNKDQYIGKQGHFRFLNYTPDGLPRCSHMHSVRDYE